MPLITIIPRVAMLMQIEVSVSDTSVECIFIHYLCIRMTIGGGESLKVAIYIPHF